MFLLGLGFVLALVGMFTHTHTRLTEIRDLLREIRDDLPRYPEAPPRPGR